MTLILYIAFYHFLLILLLLCCIIIYYYMDQRTTNRERATTGFKSLILLIVICIFLFIIGMIGTWIWTDKPNEFGDSAGVVNALFSALAFAGVIYAIILHSRDFSTLLNMATPNSVKANRRYFTFSPLPCSRCQFGILKVSSMSIQSFLFILFHWF